MNSDRVHVCVLERAQALSPLERTDPLAAQVRAGIDYLTSLMTLPER